MGLGIYLRHLFVERFLHRLVWIGLYIVCVAGCGGGDDPAPYPGENDSAQARGSLPSATATEYLKQVFARYRTSQSYRDRGEVQLRVERQGRVNRSSAPMHVALDGRALWVAAYDARLWSDSRQTVGWLADPQTDFHGRQVVVDRSVPMDGAGASARPAIKDLLRDPILAARMVSGLGGPPPQLEWLLDSDPMSKLFSDRESRIRYDGVARFDQTECVVVEVESDHERYRFWVDRGRSVIKRVELPNSIAGRRVELEGWTVRSLELVLHDATFQGSGQPLRVADMPAFDFPSRAIFLSALVPLPPNPPHRKIGSDIGRFESNDVTNRYRLTPKGADRKYTLWHRIADSSDGIELISAVNRVSDQVLKIPDSMRAKFRGVLLTDRSGASTLTQAGVAETGWLLVEDGRGAVGDALSLRPGEAGLSDTQRRLLWIGDPLDPTFASQLTALLSDADAGVDVVENLRRQWDADQKAYLHKLGELSVDPPVGFD